MKPSVIVFKVMISVDPTDDNYSPTRVIVMGGPADNLKKLNDMNVDYSQLGGADDVCILENMTEYYPVLLIKVKECRDDGIDCRVHGVKILTDEESNIGPNIDLLDSKKLIKYPKLAAFNQIDLYSRTVVLFRFMKLFDKVLMYVMPSWQHSLRPFGSFEGVRQLLPLSNARSQLINIMLRESQTSIDHVPQLFINRRKAADHRTDPTVDASYKNTVFHQVCDGLGKASQANRLDYRWPPKHTQWWECKLIGEGIIDQGGGFRDSLCDMSEELCPSDPNAAMPLPFFMATPNQNQDSGEQQDLYVPNRSCIDFAKYQWLGQLMGACFRSNEHIILALPALVWKKFVGEPVLFSDYESVDQFLVKWFNSILHSSKEEFQKQALKWKVTLADGSVADLQADDSTDRDVDYEYRELYYEKAKQACLLQFDKQIDAIRTGLVSVIPEDILQMLPWQELELRICGESNISFDDLKKCITVESIAQSSKRIEQFWETLRNFSSEDRSRLLRFVAGRRRLPCQIFVYPKDEQVKDALPSSSTCANSLYLPEYSSAKVCEQKLKYAVYNCVAIDADMNPWEDPTA